MGVSHNEWACPTLGGRVQAEVSNQIIAASIKNQPIKGLSAFGIGPGFYICFDLKFLKTKEAKEFEEILNKDNKDESKRKQASNLPE